MNKKISIRIQPSTIVTAIHKNSNYQGNNIQMHSCNDQRYRLDSPFLLKNSHLRYSNRDFHGELYKDFIIRTVASSECFLRSKKLTDKSIVLIYGSTWPVKTIEYRFTIVTISFLSSSVLSEVNWLIIECIFLNFV
jgi:hypothetical protein